MTKYYIVTCLRGHLGCGNGTEIKFAIAAENLLHACNIAKKMPAIKHTRMVLSGKEISYEDFLEYRKTSAYNRFNNPVTKKRFS